jgi:hypothetical protein
MAPRQQVHFPEITLFLSPCACGDFGIDPHHSIFLVTSSASGHTPLAPPIDPPYKKALLLKRNGKFS